MATKYNGWTNYATWCVHLHLTNEEGDAAYWEERAADCYGHCFGQPSDATYRLSGELKESYTEVNRPELAGCYADLLGSVLSDVNWIEIAQAFIDNVIEEGKS